MFTNKIKEKLSAHVSAKSTSIVPPTPKNSYPKFRNTMTTFEKKTLKKLKKTHQGEVGGDF